MTTVESIDQLNDPNTKQLIKDLEEIKDYKSDDVKSISIHIKLTVGAEVTISSELNNQWGSTSRKRIMWVKGHLTKSFVNDVKNEIVKFCSLSYDDKLTYGVRIQKYPARFKDGKITDTFDGIFPKEFQPYPPKPNFEQNDTDIHS